MIEKIKLLDVSAVAKRLSVSERTIYRMLKDPESPLEGVAVYRSIKVIADTVPLCIRPIKFSDNCDNYDNPAKCDTLN